MVETTDLSKTFGPVLPACDGQCARTNDAYLGLLSAFAWLLGSLHKSFSLLILSQFLQNLESATFKLFVMKSHCVKALHSTSAIQP
jgi:hypothetical protein